MPVWPFSPRSIRHRTFGTLKPVRNGKFLRARIPCPRGGQKPVELHITAGEAGPTAEQESLFLSLRQQYPSLYTDALRAVHGEYQRVRQVQPNLEWPTAGDVGELEPLTPLDRIWLDDASGKQFVLSFNHARDKEHSFHVFFKDGKVRSVASER